MSRTLLEINHIIAYELFIGYLSNTLDRSPFSLDVIIRIAMIGRKIFSFVVRHVICKEDRQSFAFSECPIDIAFLLLGKSTKNKYIE